MNPRTIFSRAQNSPHRWVYWVGCVLQFLLVGTEVAGQSKSTPVRTAYSALSAGIGTLWLTHEDGHFRKHGLESNLIYIPGGATAVQALLAGEIQFGHLSPAPMMGGILSPPTSTTARDMGYRSLLHIPDLGREFTFSGIAAKRSFVQSQPEVVRAYIASLTDGAQGV